MMTFDSLRTDCALRYFHVEKLTGSILSLVAALAIFFAQASCAEASGNLRTVALTGDAAPTRPGEEGTNPIFLSYSARIAFESVVINDHGQTAFYSSLGTKRESPFDELFRTHDGIVRESANGSLTLVALEGDQVPGADENATFRFFPFVHKLHLNNRGQLAFSSSFHGPFVEEDGVLESVLSGHTSDLIPGKVLSQSVSSFKFNDRGQLAFRLGIFDPDATSTSDYGVFLTEAGSGELTLVTQDGDRPPGLEDFLMQSVSPGALSDEGELVIGSRVIADRVFTHNGDVILRGVPGALSLIAHVGSPSPGLEEGVTYSPGQFKASWSSDGQAYSAFTASLRGGGINFANDSALFVEDAAQGVQLIAREGAPAPVGSPDSNYNLIFTDNALNSQGHLLFRTSLVLTVRA